MTAQERFRCWVVREGGVENAGVLLGCSRAHVSFLQTGRRIPSLRLAARVERITNGWIQASSWIEAKEPVAA